MMTCELVLAAALLTPGQALPAGAKITISGDFEVHNARESVNEQIEVMRALLMHKLGGQPRSAVPMGTSPESDQYYPPSQSLASWASGSMKGQASQAPAVEGSYLDGYGVVFTVMLPATARDPRTATDAKPEPALTDWEHERRRLLGQLMPDKATAPKRTSVTDVLVKLLAENGKNFTGLKEDERVVIAVTFRAQGADASTVRAAPSPNMGLPMPVPPKGDKAASLESIGDLHLKQGQPEAAVDAYAKAVAAAEEDWKSVIHSPDGNFPKTSIYNAMVKLAQAYLAAGKFDDARQTMERAAALREKASQPPPKSANKAAEVRGPTRLTVSAPKKLLDQVGNGQMNMDEFRKKVTVEYIPAGKE